MKNVPYKNPDQYCINNNRNILFKVCKICLENKWKNVGLASLFNRKGYSATELHRTCRHWRDRICDVGLRGKCCNHRRSATRMCLGRQTTLAGSRRVYWCNGQIHCLYAREAWTLNAELHKKIMAVGMSWCLRRILAIVDMDLINKWKSPTIPSLNKT